MSKRNNSPIQDYVHPDNQTQPTFEGFFEGGSGCSREDQAVVILQGYFCCLRMLAYAPMGGGRRRSSMRSHGDFRNATAARIVHTNQFGILLLIQGSLQKGH